MIFEEDIKKEILYAQNITKRLMFFIEDCIFNINIKPWDTWKDFQEIYYKEIISKSKPTSTWKNRVKNFSLTE